MTEQAEDKGEKGSGGFLRRMLKGAWFAASALILPLDIKFKGKKKIALNYAKAAIYSLTYLVLQPAATFLFPSAEKILEKNGLNPELAQELAPGKKIYVREDNFLGNLHVIMDQPLLFLPFNHMYWSDDVRAYAQPGERFLGISRPSLYIKNPEITIDSFKKAVEGTSVLIDPGKCFPSHSESFLKTLLHEIRHCSDANQSLTSTLAMESDADYHAISILAREAGDPFLPESFVNFQAMFSAAETHDDALYLDAMFNKKSVPSFNDIRQANREARVIYDSLYGKVLVEAMGGCDPQYNLPSCAYDEKAEMAKMSELGRRRAQFYDASIRKFFVRDSKKDSVMAVSVPARRHGA